MPSPAVLLELIGQAILPALADLAAPIDTTALAREMWSAWGRERDDAGRRNDLDALLQTDLSAIIPNIVQGLLPGKPTPAHAALTRYLSAVQACLERHPALEPRAAADLLRWLPVRVPRFQAGESPLGVGDRELARIARLALNYVCWLAVNPHLGAPAVPLAFLPDRDRALAAVGWHRRWREQGAPAGVVALDHTFLDKDLPCLQFAAATAGKQPREASVANATLYRQVVEIVARLHKLKEPLAVGSLDLADVLIDGSTPALLVIDPGAATPRDDVRQLGRLGQHLLGPQGEALTALLSSPDAEDASVFLAKLEPLLSSQLAKPTETAPRPRTKAASKLWDVLGTIEKPQAELAKLVTNTLGMKFALIPAGTFRMGSPPGEGGRRENEGPVHDVILTKPFYLAHTPVTQAQYQAVMGTNPSRFQGAAGGGWEHPVECVSWDDAAAFCKKLSEKPAEKAAGHTYRLPTEAEWEYACRAGSGAPFHFGDSLDAAQACFDGSYPYGEGRYGPTAPRTARVLSFAANHFGLYDMHGNVWEWCADWYDADYYRTSPRQDPPGPASGTFRVLRGGAWRNQAATCRAAYRNALAPNQRQPFIGFRVVLMLAASDA